MLEEGVALTQSQTPSLHIQQTAQLVAARAVKEGGGGGVIAGIQTQAAFSGHGSSSSLV